MATDLPLRRHSSRLLGLQHTRIALAGLAASAGLIHLVAAIEHVGSDLRLAVFFGLVGIGQLAAAWLIHRDRADELLLKLVAAVSIALALLWAVSLTAGIFAEIAEDTLAALLQLAFAAIVAVIVTRGEQRLAWLSSAIGIRLTVIVLSLSLMLALFGGGHEH